MTKKNEKETKIKEVETNQVEENVTETTNVEEAVNVSTIEIDEKAEKRSRFIKGALKVAKNIAVFGSGFALGLFAGGGSEDEDEYYEDVSDEDVDDDETESDDE